MTTITTAYDVHVRAWQFSERTRKQAAEAKRRLLANSLQAEAAGILWADQTIGTLDLSAWDGRPFFPKTFNGLGYLCEEGKKAAVREMNARLPWFVRARYGTLPAKLAHAHTPTKGIYLAPSVLFAIYDCIMP